MSIDATEALLSSREHYETLRDQPTADPEGKKAAFEWLREHDELRAAAERAQEYEAFALALIQREQRRFRQGERERPLCECSPSNCPLKEGELPRELRDADSITDGVQAFRTRRHHDGEPVVLSEIAAAYSELEVALENVYERACQMIEHSDGSGHGKYLDPEETRPDERIRLDEQTADVLGIEYE